MPVFYKRTKSGQNTRQFQRLIAYGLILTLIFIVVSLQPHNIHTPETGQVIANSNDTAYEIIYPGENCFLLADCPLNGRIWSLLTHSYGEDKAYIVYPDYHPPEAHDAGNEELIHYDGCVSLLADAYDTGNPIDCLLDVYGNVIVVIEAHHSFAG